MIPCYSKENTLRKLLWTFKHNPTIRSKVIGHFSQYFGLVGGTTRTSRDSTQLQEKQPMETTLKIRGWWVGSQVIDLLSRYSSRVVGMPKQTSSACSSDSMLLQGKQPTETRLKLWVRSNGRIKSYGPFQQVLWSRRWYDPNGHRRRGVGIPHSTRKTSYGNSSKILVRSNGRIKSYRHFDSVL
jgi:hypothetical protein